MEAILPTVQIGYVESFTSTSFRLIGHLHQQNHHGTIPRFHAKSPSTLQAMNWSRWATKQPVPVVWSSVDGDQDVVLSSQTTPNIHSHAMASNSGATAHHTSTRRESFRHLFSKSGAVATAVSALTSTMMVASATAATSSSTSNIITPEEVKRIQIGYQQINYLLDHFEEETTVCRENGGECKRDANSIRKVLGLRSTTDPLFQIEKVFAKFKNLSLDGDADVDIEALYDAAEDWNSSISMSNSMAFISQFGEYNPGGGKDEVLKYLLESKKQVLFAKDALKTIMINLKIPLSNE